MGISFNKESLISFAKERKYIGMLQIVIGIILFVIREFFIQSIVLAIGGILAVLGLIYFILVFRRPKELKSIKSYITPTILMIIGVCLLAFPAGFIEIVVIIIGICIILKGIANLFNKYYGDNAKYFLISNIINIALGALIIIFRNSADSFFVVFLAFEIIFSGVIDILISLNTSKIVKASGNDDTVNVEM